MNLKSSPFLRSHKNNCFLLAMKEACSWLDEKHIIDVGMVNNFYHPKSGSKTGLLTKYMDHLGIQYEVTYKKSFKETRSEVPTIKRFVEQNPDGVFIIGVNGHALVLNNGRIVDPNMGNYGIQRKVTHAFKILNTDLKPEVFRWDQDTKFVKCNGRLGGFGFKTGSKNHKFMIEAFADLSTKDPFTYRDLKKKHSDLTMDQFVYFVSRGIFRPHVKEEGASRR